MSMMNYFQKRKLYLLNYSSSIEANLRHLSKFVVQQIQQEFSEAAYNDRIAGALYNFDRETQLRSQLGRNDCYFELLVPVSAISHVTPEGRVIVYPGYDGKVLTLKTLLKSYRYDEKTHQFVEITPDTMSSAGQKIYNYAPGKWPLFAAERKRVFPATTSSLGSEEIA